SSITSGIQTGTINTTTTQQSGGGGLLSGLGTVGSLLGGAIDLIGNLSNIGASTNPTQEMNSFMGFAQPILENYINDIINAPNPQEHLTELEQFLQFQYQGYKHLLDHHTRASSTREAYTVVLQKINEIKAATVN